VTTEEVKYIHELDVNRQLSAIYREDEQTIDERQSPPTGQRSFFTKQEKITRIDDYIKLSNIREVLFEVVHGVNVRKSSSGYRLRIVGDPPLPSFYEPLFLLDGIPLLDFDEFLRLPPDRLNEIRLINKVYIHGNAVLSGIVSFRSVNNDLAGLELPEKSILLSIELPEKSLKWDYPATIQSEKNVPILSNTLYRKSFVTSIKEKYLFRANNNLGKYVHRVRGFDSDGKWIYSKKDITVSAGSSIEIN
jgi:hypothetical protein